MRSTLRCGLVGLGDAGGHHAQAPARAAAFSSLEALLASGACDAVILATPAADGARAARSCAEGGA